MKSKSACAPQAGGNNTESRSVPRHEGSTTVIPVQVSTPIPGPLSQGMAERLIKAVPLATYAGLYGIFLRSARGVYLTDIDGNRFLDFLAGASAVSVGYGREDVVDAYNRAAL